MKKKMVTMLLIVCGMLAITKAQEVKYGAKAGLNLANLTGDVDNTEMKIGFHIGGMVEIPLLDKFSVQPEILFSTQGAKIELNDDIYNSIDDFKLNYITIPVMAKYYVMDNLSIEAGPQASFLLTAKNKWEDTSFGITETGEIDIKDEVNKFDLGLNIGAGYKLENGLNFGARYSFGLTNIVKNNDNDLEKISAKNGVAQISVGYFF